MQAGYFVASRRETPVALLRPSQNKLGRLVFAALVVSLGLAMVPSAVRALELPKPEPVAKYLGKAATGPNYTVKPLVRSDGVMRIFDVDTPYGQFAFDGDRVRQTAHSRTQCHCRDRKNVAVGGIWQGIRSRRARTDQVRCRPHHQPRRDRRALADRHRQHVRSCRCWAIEHSCRS